MLRIISFLASLLISVCLSFNCYAQAPTATLSGTQTVCAGVPANLQVVLTGSGPWNFSYSDGTAVKNITNVNQNPYIFSVNPLVSTTYNLISVSNIIGNGTVNGTSIITVNPVIFNPSTNPAFGVTVNGPNPIFCSSGSTSLIAPAGYVYYVWLKGNGSQFQQISSSTDSILDITSLGSGYYIVIAVDANCNSVSSSIGSTIPKGIRIESNDPFAKPVISGSPILQCGNITTLSATEGFIKYEWKKNNTVIQTGTSNTLNATLYGVGDYTVTVYAAVGCFNTSDKVAVTRTETFAKPQISPYNIYVKCFGGNNTLTTAPGLVKYEWKINNIIVQSGINNTIDANIYGNGVYSVTAYNIDGCNQLSDNYYVNLLPAGTSPSISASLKTICPGQFSQLAITSGLYKSYQWSNGDTSSFILVNQPGNYSVTVTDISGCINNASITLAQPANISTLAISASTPTRLCGSGNYPVPTYTMGSSVVNSNYQYNWYRDGKFFSNDMAINTSFTGAYTLKLFPLVTSITSTCYTTSNTIDAIYSMPPIQSVKNSCGALSSYLHTANGAISNQIYKWYETSSSVAVIYTSINSSDNTLASSLSSVYVSIYDQISGCETSRTKMNYIIDPLKLSDQTVNICTDGNAGTNIVLTTDNYTGGTYTWYTVPTGGTPIYTSSSNTYSIPKPTQNTIFYVDFKSKGGCQTTSRAAINISVLQPPVLTVPSNLCEGAVTTITMPPISGVTYFLYDSPTASTFLNAGYSYFIITASGTKTYYVSASINGCSTTRTAITVSAIPIPSATYTVTTLCDQKATITFTGQALPSATYTWNFAGGTIISGSGAGPYVVRWSVAGMKSISLQVTQNGCTSNTTSQNYNVLTAPVPSFSLASTAFCQSATAVPLTGSPAGGVFSGTGINGNTYTPSGIGTSTITYTYTNPSDACVYTTAKNVTVNPMPAVSINGLDATYCKATTGIPLTLSPAGGTLSGTGISGTSFTPSAVGQNTITYTYKDANNCSNTATKTITVYAVPVVSFTGLNTTYCRNSTASVLTGSPAGGTFSGTGMSGATFTPSIQGTNTITYSYSKDGCVNTATQNTTVKPANTYVQFDGVDDFIKVPSIDAYNIGTGDFTIEATVIVDKTQGNGMIPILSKTSNGQDGFYLCLSKNQLFIRIGKDAYNSNSFFDINDARAHQITITRTAGLVTFYLDMAYIGSQFARTTSSIISAADLYIGRNIPTNFYLKGSVTDVRLWNRVQLWSSGINASSPGLIGYWPLTECDGQYAVDKSTNGNNGVFGLTAAVETTDPLRTTNSMWITADLIRSACSFEASSNDSRRIEIPHHTAYETFNTGNSFTIEAKIYSKGMYLSDYPTIFSKRSSTTTGFAFGIYNGKLFFKIGNELYTDNSNTYNLLTPGGTCYHVAITRFYDYYTFYVNGVATSSFARPRSIGSSSPIWLGNDRGGNNVLNCDLDEVRIWNYPRSTAQIAAGINEVYTEQTNGLIGYYTFDEYNESQWVIDRSTTNNYGFLGSNASAPDLDEPLRTKAKTCGSGSRTSADTDGAMHFETATVSAEVVLYPNPFESNVTVKILHTAGEATIQVLDAEGKIIYLKENHPVQEELRLGDSFPQGMYLIQFPDRPELKSVKFIKVL